MDIPQTPTEDQLRALREEGTPEWIIEKLTEEWPLHSVLTAYRDGAITREEAECELIAMGYDESDAYHTLKG